MFQKAFLPGALLATALLLTARTDSFGQNNSQNSSNDAASTLRRTQIGEVTQIGNDQLMIVINGRKPMNLKIDQGTKISIDGKPAGLKDVRRGDTVRVVTRENDSAAAEMLDVATDPEEEARLARGGAPGQNDRNGPQRDQNEELPSVALGIAMADEPGDKGVEVEQVHPGSPADRAGLRQGDILVSIDGKDVKHARDVRELLHSKRTGDRLQIIVKRNGENKTMSATLIGRDEIFGGQGPNQQQFGQPPFGQPQHGQQQFGQQQFGQGQQQFGQGGGGHPTFRVERRAWLGLGLDDEKNGVEVERVYPAGPAARAGFEMGDKIATIDGKKISKAEDVSAFLDKAQPGSKVSHRNARWQRGEAGSRVGRQ